MRGTRVPYSSFLRGPSAVLPRVVSGDVLLERRDGEDLVLTTASRADALHEGLGVGAAALRQIAREHPDVIADSLSEALPWLSWLPTDERDMCVRELLDDLAAGGDVENFTRFQRDLVAWRSTAEIWSDPQLAGRLRTEFTADAGVVSRPSTHGC